MIFLIQRIIKIHFGLNLLNLLKEYIKTIDMITLKKDKIILKILLKYLIRFLKGKKKEFLKYIENVYNNANNYLNRYKLFFESKWTNIINNKMKYKNLYVRAMPFLKEINALYHFVIPEPKLTIFRIIF